MNDSTQKNDSPSTDSIPKTADQPDAVRSGVAENPSPGIIGKSSGKDGWERETLEKLLFATLKEQRARRRWGIFFKIVTLGVVLLLISQFTSLGAGTEKLEKHTALIEIEGTIESDGKSAAESVISALNRAYSEKSAVGIILLANSPGGSPVQAGMINDEIMRLRLEYPDKPLYVVVEEMCASGCYYVASAADKIFVNKSSVIGSIGVMINGFGFTGLMEKAGVERRLLTAGENKGFLDPFSPQSASHKAYAKSILTEIHQQFIDVVRKGRGKRLKENEETFSGLFWSGAKAVELGLADDFGSVDSVARDVLNTEEIVDYTEKERLSDRVMKKFGASIGAGIFQSGWSKARMSFQ